MAYVLVSCCSVKGIALGYSLFDACSGEVGERCDKDNGKLVVRDSGSIRGLRCWEQLKSIEIKIFSEVAIFWDSGEMSNKPFLALPFVIWQS